MIDRPWLPPVITALAAAATATSLAYVADLPLEIGLLILAVNFVFTFLLIDVFRDYTVGFPLAVFSSLGFLVWGPASVPWALAGNALSFAVQFALWRGTHFYVPSERLRLASERDGVTSLGRFVTAGTSFCIDWYAFMILLHVPYRFFGGRIPVNTDSWGQLFCALGFLLTVNAWWLLIAEVRAAEIRRRLDDSAPRSLSLYAWALFGVYVPIPGTVLILFAVAELHDKGLSALLLWTAASIPLHFGMKALLRASTAYYGAERERDRQRQFAMIAAQSSTILHEAVHQIGLLSLLLPPSKDPSSPAFLREARSVLGELEQTIEHFRVSLRRHEIGRTPIELRQLIEDACRTATGGDESRLRCRPCVEHCVILGHAFLLQSAVANVARNALEASPAGVAAELDVVRGNGSVRILVRDHGPGIPAAEQDRVFEASYSRKGKGLGLGLYLAREVIAAHGGSIEVDAPPDGGACFAITLPLADGKT